MAHRGHTQNTSSRGVRRYSCGNKVLGTVADLAHCSGGESSKGDLFETRDDARCKREHTDHRLVPEDDPQAAAERHREGRARRTLSHLSCCRPAHSRSLDIGVVARGQRLHEPSLHGRQYTDEWRIPVSQGHHVFTLPVWTETSWKRSEMLACANAPY